MSDFNTKCSRCGATVSPDALQGICPACLLALNLSAPTEELGPEGTRVSQSPPPNGPSIEELKNLFPQLEIIGSLGRGGMGAVYKARQPGLDRFVALKILLRRESGAGADTAFAGRFSREARALARLAHPDIVAVYDYGEAGGYPYFIMEFVDGLTLREVLRRGKLDPEQALAIVPKICDALQFAHQQGVVHRDIKPENILMDQQGHVKIADFGIAKIVDPAPGQPVLTGGKDVIGTPHYMAPEQVEQPGKVDHRADIFSLGVVFYEMLTGELPLGKFCPPSSKVTVDVRLDEIVLRALEKEPERRYQNISQVKTDVEHVSTTSAKGSDLAGAVQAAQTGRGRTPSAKAVGGNVAGPALPVSLALLGILMVALGLYAFFETVIRQQPGLAIFPNVFCLWTGIGLLFLKRWARILALAWVAVSYLLFAVLTLMMVMGLFSGWGPDLRIDLMGRAAANPRQLVVAVIVFVSAALMVPWTHWLLTRDPMKRLFGIDGASASTRGQKLGFAAAIATIVAALLVYMAMPKQLGSMLSGTVTSAATGKPVQAEITVIGSKSRKWRTATDRQGSYTIQVPPNAGFLYREDNVDHSIEVLMRVNAAGFETGHMDFGKTRSLGFYRRTADFQLQPLAAGAASSQAPAQAVKLDDVVVKAVNPFLFHIRRVLLDSETNASTVWLETRTPGEPRLPVDKAILLSALDLEAASLTDELFSSAGPAKMQNAGIEIKMTTAATSRFSELTKTNIHRRLAIIIENKILSAPVVASQIPSGLGQISGNFSFPELLALCARLNRLARAAEHKILLPNPKRESGVIDLDSGRWIAWPAQMPDWNEDAIDRWLKNVGADCVSPPDVADGAGLGVLRMRMAHLPPDAWINTPARNEVVAALSATNIAAASRPAVRLQIGPKPAVYAFCTAAGSAGVMQPVAEGGHIVLRYKIFQPDGLPVLSPNQTRPAPPANPEDAQAVIHKTPRELTLNDDGTGRDFFLDFETGRTFTPPKGLDFNSPASLQWVRTNGIDAVGETSTSVRGLVGVEMTAMPVPAQRWAGIEAKDLLDNAVLNHSAAGSHTILSAKGKLPETYIFKTREGARGILQITGFRQEPRGVQIRYRLVETPSRN